MDANKNSIEHLVERLGLFTLVALGEFIVAVSLDNYGKQSYALYISACAGILTALMFKWVYFDIEFEEHRLHALRRSRWTGLLWLQSHFPFLASIVISSVGMTNLIGEIQTEYAPHTSTTAHIAARAETEKEIHAEWMLACGVGAALLLLAFIATLHFQERGARIRWEYRVLISEFCFICLFLISQTRNDCWNPFDIPACNGHAQCTWHSGCCACCFVCSFIN
jgi:hypothetical protein